MLYLVFIIGLILLAMGGDIMVSGAVSLAKRFHVSTLLIGIVLIGFGTSTPELLASLIAVLQKPPAPGISVGNVVGSNIANILLVLGITAIINPISIEKKSFKKDAFFLILSSLALVLAAWQGIINHFYGCVLVMLLIFYVGYSYQIDRRNKKAQKEADKEINAIQENPTWLAFMMTFGGIGLTVLGAKFLVDTSIILAKNWGISETVIGLTMVAVGTSLPELATSVMAAIRKQNALAFGNIVGSNIYNALFILGVVSLFAPIPIPDDVPANLLAMCIATGLLLLAGLCKQGISRKIGFFFLMFYVGYILWLALQSLA